MKSRVAFEQGVEPAYVIDLVVCRPPVKGRGFVNIDFFRCIPFHPIGKTKSPIAGTKSAQGSAHPGKGL